MDAWDTVRLRTASTQWNAPVRYGPRGEPCFFPVKSEPMVLKELFRFGPSIPVKTVKACALIGLHMIEENPGGRKWLLYFVKQFG